MENVCVCLVLYKTASVCLLSVRLSVCVSIGAMGGNIGFKDIGEDSLSITAVQEVVFKAVLVQTFLPHLFSISLFEKSAVQYANVLFFKKCYCTVNIIVNIFVSS